MLAIVGGFLLGASEAAAAPVASFDDIEYWVGTGSNQAAVAIDWFEDSIDEPAIVWGFRWDGAATGQTMLSAVIAADPRLFAKSGGFGGLGASLYGLGYDDGNGEFALDDDTAFDELGFAADDGPADGASAVDSDDRYREGWFTGYWNYGLSIDNPFDGGSWKVSNAGMTSRTLQNGDWDSWAFTVAFDFTTFAENPLAAEPPSSGGDADFNGDGGVDGADFLAWQRGFGIATGAEPEMGDANGDGAVDAADLSAWKGQFGDPADPPPTTLAAVPEPTTFALAGAAALCVAAWRRQIDGGSKKRRVRESVKHQSHRLRRWTASRTLLPTIRPPVEPVAFMETMATQPPRQEPLPLSLKPGDFYFDQGRFVLTESYLQRRGICCGHGCRHCPFPAGEQVASLPAIVDGIEATP